MRFITVLSCVFRIYCAYCVVRTLNIPPEDILKANGVNGSSKHLNLSDVYSVVNRSFLMPLLLELL